MVYHILLFLFWKCQKEITFREFAWPFILFLTAFTFSLNLFFFSLLLVLDGTNDTASKRNSSESEQNGSCGNMTPGAGAAAASVHTPVADAVSFGNIQLTPGFDPCKWQYRI